jgi:cytochrome P450
LRRGTNLEDDVVGTLAHSGVASLPLAPKSPLPYRQRARAAKSFHTGPETLRDAGGPVTRFTLGPRWLVPPIVLATSPGAIRDILAVNDDNVDKTSPVLNELRRILGDNSSNLPRELWIPRRRTLQPMFTKQHVSAFGGHMARAAERVSADWSDGDELDLDAEARTITLRALGHSVLGMDLDQRLETVAQPLGVALRYAMSRALRPIRAPRWMYTPARRRARAASAAVHELAADIVRACRADPTRDAPLVHALLAAKDPLTGKGLSDEEICDELIIFIFAGHDTTATTVAYALWALGHNTDQQDRVAEEVAELPDGPLTPDDIPKLGYTVQVIRESLRLCPPAPTGTRMSVRDIEVGGYRVKAGTMLVFGRMAVQRDPTLWDDPLRFDPDRFHPEHVKGRDRWQYIPFGGGPRSCLGDHFAMLEATLALATVIRRAEITSLEAEFPLALHFTMIAGGPVRASVRRRQ